MVSMMQTIKFTGRDKLTGNKEASKWRSAVDKVLLNAITPAKIAVWRDDYVAPHQAGG